MKLRSVFYGLVAPMVTVCVCYGAPSVESSVAALRKRLIETSDLLTQTAQATLENQKQLQKQRENLSQLMSELDMLKGQVGQLRTDKEVMRVEIETLQAKISKR